MSSAGIDDWAAPQGTANADDWATPGANASATTAPPSNGGIGKNIGAGFLEGLTGIPSAITDPASRMLEAVSGFLPSNQAPKGSTAAALGAGRSNVNPIPAGSISHTLNKGLGLIGLNPEDVPANTFPERAARMAGMGATAALFPEVGGEELAGAAAPTLSKVVSRAANTPIASAGRRALTGTVAGATGATGEELAPQDMPALRTAVGTLASIAGGTAAESPGLVRAGLAGAGNFLRPLTTAGQEQTAADIFRSRATNPSDVLNNLASGQQQIITGSEPTTFQQTGDLGLGGLENEISKKNPAPFIQRRADQNQARQTALAGIQQDGDPDAVGTFLRGQFRNFDDQTHQHLDALTAAAQQQTEALGGTGVPEQHGAALRDALQTAENSARARERGLWQAVDPDRNLVVSTQPIKDAANEITGGMSSSAKPMSGEEKAIFDLTSNYDPTMPFADLSDLRSRTSAAMRDELVNSGSTPSYARLSRLRGAIQNNLADAATNQAALDAQAVAAGTISPEQTLTGKIQGWVNDFYGTRAAQSGAAGGEGIAARTGAGQAGAGSPNGTGLPPEGGFPNAEGATGISTQPQPFDEAASQRLAEASAATKARAGTFGQGPIGQTLAKAGTQDAYRLPEARVPEKFFHAGPTSFQDIQGLRQTVGDDAAMPILRDYAAASLRRVAENPDGTLNPAKVTAWTNKYGNALRAFPDLQSQFSNAANISDTIATAAADRRAAIADRNSSAIGKVMNANNADDVTRTVAGIFGKKNATQSMQDLAQAASRSPEATQGLRQAVADHIANRFISNTESGTSGSNLIKADAFQTFVRQNRGALGAVLSPEEMGTLDRISSDLHRANRSISGTKLPGGSDTAQNMYGMMANNPNATVLDRALSESGATIAGAALGHATGAGLGWMGARVANAMRASGMNKVNDLLTEALLNPDFAGQLLRKAPAQADSGQSVALASRLRRIALASAATRLGPSQKQTSP